MLYEEPLEQSDEQRKLNELANQAKRDFLTSMSHELRTPLNAVLGFCQMLDSTALDKEQTQMIRGIRRSGELLLNLIENILDISKMDNSSNDLDLIPFSLSDFMTEIIDLFRTPASDKGIMLSYSLCSLASQNVLGSPNRLRKILVNLIDNAIKFTDFGQVHIRVESDTSRTNGVANFRFSVVDTGIGIRDSDRSKIFQKFSQAESGYTRRFGGMGLGLVLCKQLAQMMNGEIDFESEYGAGSIFWIRIPLTLTHLPSQLPDYSPSLKVFKSSSEKKKLHILVVDDSSDSLLVTGLFLQRLGHSCDLVNSGLDALKELNQHQYDLILMDMQMPELDGCQTTQKIRALGNSVPIVALTANAFEDDIKRCYDFGMNDYLSKPILVEKLDRMLEKWSRKISLC